MKHWSKGPFSVDDEEMFNNCQESWWTNLLYINNFVKLDQMVMFKKKRKSPYIVVRLSSSSNILRFVSNDISYNILLYFSTIWQCCVYSSHLLRESLSKMSWIINIFDVISV